VEEDAPSFKDVQTVQDIALVLQTLQKKMKKPMER